MNYKASIILFYQYIPLLYNIKNKTKLHLTLFFTYPVSLKIWDDNGLLDREIKIYQRLISRYNLSITFLTYGDKTDSIIANRIDDICVIPIYEKLYKPKNKLIRFINRHSIHFIYN